MHRLLAGFRANIRVYDPELPKGILEGECDWWGCESETADRVNQFEHYKYPADGCSQLSVRRPRTRGCGR